MLRFGTMKFAAVIGLLWGLVPGVASAEYFVARLAGSEEVPANTSSATGFFQMNFVNAAGNTNYQLAYRNLEGTITQSHIHIGPPGVNGGVVIWLCQTAAAPAPVANVPNCAGTTAGVVNGIGVNGINAAKVLALPANLVDAGNLNEVIINAIRMGTAYVNVHTTVVPGGEIRGQLK